MIHLLIFQDGTSRNIELTENLYTLGRSPKCSIQITSNTSPLSISRFHAYLVKVAPDTYHIEDGAIDGTRSKSGILIKSNGSEWVKKLSAKLINRDCILFPPDVTLQYSTCCPDETVGTEHGTLY